MLFYVKSVFSNMIEMTDCIGKIIENSPFIVFFFRNLKNKCGFYSLGLYNH